MWYALDSGAIILRTVISDKYKPSSPLFKGRLEIPIKVFVSWFDEKSMTIHKEKVKSVNYPCDMDYIDDLKNLKRFLLGESMEEDKEEMEVWKTTECDTDQRPLSQDII